MECLITTATMNMMLECLALVSNFVLNHHCPKTCTTLIHNTCMYMYFSQFHSKLVSQLFSYDHLRIGLNLVHN